MTTDFIQTINWLSQIVEELRDSGEELWANRLDSSLRIGGTSSELLGEIRNFLILFSKSGIPHGMMIDKKIKKALKDLDKVLGKRSAILKVYDWLPKMVADLNAVGEEKWAKSLDRALQSSGTSVMQFEEIQLFLKDFSQSGVPKTLRIERKVRKVLNELEKVFGKRLNS